MLVHLDPETHRISYLSIPRDLRVEIPGYGTSKINAANQIGGPALTLATVKALTGLPIDHVVVVDFDGFKELIDAIGGIEVNVPKPILSNRSTAPTSRRAAPSGRAGASRRARSTWTGGARSSTRGSARTSSTRPTPTSRAATASRSSPTRSGDEIASFGTFLRLPFMGDDARGAARDRPLGLGARTARLGAVPLVRRSLRCRLGGEPSSLGGESVLLGSEDNVAVISMWLGTLGAPRRRRRGRSTAPAARGASCSESDAGFGFASRRRLLGRLVRRLLAVDDGVAVLRPSSCASRSPSSRSPSP